MGLAEPAQLPTVVVGDIDRGGVFAAFYGTLALLDPRDQALISAFVINKFRGDIELLKPGIETLTRLTGRPTLGVVPWQLEVWLDSEDNVPYGLVRAPSPGEPEWLHVVVLRLPHTSNATDVDALASEPGVRVLFTAETRDLANADLIVIPGTKSTVDDLEWVIQRGFADAIRVHVAMGKPLIGLCGGFQMLVEQINDQVESGRTNVEGLGLLPLGVTFDSVKQVRRCSGVALGAPVSGYEIHHGYVADSSPEVRPFITLANGTHEGAISQDGNVFGTHWHGIFESDEFRGAFLREVARLAERGDAPNVPQIHYASTRQRMLDLLGDLVEEHLDTDALWKLIERGAPSDLPILRPALLHADTGLYS
jgi:adenosylcobyric acid synthase